LSITSSTLGAVLTAHLLDVVSSAARSALKIGHIQIVHVANAIASLTLNSVCFAFLDVLVSVFSALDAVISVELLLDGL
jgi:HEAT repeat protein